MADFTIRPGDEIAFVRETTDETGDVERSFLGGVVVEIEPRDEGKELAVRLKGDEIVDVGLQDVISFNALLHTRNRCEFCGADAPEEIFGPRMCSRCADLKSHIAGAPRVAARIVNRLNAPTVSAFPF